MNAPLDPRATAPVAQRPLRFAHVVIVGKYQAPGARHVVEEIAQFLLSEGCEVSLEHQTALNTGLTDHPSLDVAAIPCSAQLALVVGGDGTLLGIGRQMVSLARSRVVAPTLYLLTVRESTSASSKPSST